MRQRYVPVIFTRNAVYASVQVTTTVRNDYKKDFAFPAVIARHSGNGVHGGNLYDHIVSAKATRGAELSTHLTLKGAESTQPVSS